jgi:hypothetical protein
MKLMAVGTQVCGEARIEYQGENGCAEAMMGG